jgi:hypothetical protein
MPFDLTSVGAIRFCGPEPPNIPDVAIIPGQPSPPVPPTRRAEPLGVVLQTLERFNRKVEHLHASGFARRFEDAVPSVVAAFRGQIEVEPGPGGILHITGELTSDLEDFDQDEIDAFVLTLRLFTQKNDSISLVSLARIYDAAWMPAEARERFVEAQTEVNAYLESQATVMLEDGPVTVGYIVDVVIYGGMAHTNSKKAELFENWIHSGISGFIWAEFYAHAKKMLAFLDYFRTLNDAVLAAVRVTTTNLDAQTI